MTLRKMVKQLLSKVKETNENVKDFRENVDNVLEGILDMDMAKSYELDKKHKMFNKTLEEIQEALSGQTNYDRQEETHFIRPIDELGRIVIPKELREKYQVKDGQDEFNIWTKGDYIVLKKA